MYGFRYTLQDRIGAGGMGIVYRALDRLTGNIVALKSVHTAPDQLLFNSRTAGKSDLNFALAHEFEILAGLRHPNIISVLDYGFGVFEQEQRPFFTMELLEGAVNLREAAVGQPLATQVRWLGDVLRALAYLHRRGVLHRDLKPGNILIKHGIVKVLDFGLAVNTDYHPDTRTTTGTVGYLAPEVLSGNAYTPAADLYALGVIAYELFTGRYPYQFHDLSSLINQIRFTPLSFNDLAIPSAAQEFLQNLLEKSVSRRYQEVKSALTALNKITGGEPPPENTTIRESFLQAARFVERETELTQLIYALGSEKRGGWLVGGESGVGKTRLMNELRTRALVRGVLVSIGESKDNGGMPFQAWQPIVHRLALSVEMTPFEVGVLRRIVPDLHTRLSVKEVQLPRLAPAAARERLYAVMIRLIERQPTPCLIILEDIHWADESTLALLNKLITQPGLPALFVATYRDDETPQLPAQFPSTQFLKLQRLTELGIARLSQSILGTAGLREDLLALLQRETEGNVFFLVEVIRALAEHAGQLEQIGQSGALPTHLLTTGVQQIVTRRLDQIPPIARPLLDWAAVVGRVVDIRLLEQVIGLSEETINNYLQLASESAVIEVSNGRWRFSHDKFREGVLTALDSEFRKRCHAKVLFSIETVYANELSTHYAELAYHAAESGDLEKELHYSGLAGRQAAGRFANQAAITLLSRALMLTSESDWAARYELLSVRERVYDLMADRKLQSADLAELERLSDLLGDDQRRADVAARLAGVAEVTGEYLQAIEIGNRAIQLAEKVHDEIIMVDALGRVGRAYRRLSRYGETQAIIQKMIQLARTHNLPDLEAEGLRVTAFAYSELGRVIEARGVAEYAYQLSKDAGHITGQLMGGVLLSHLVRISGDLEQGLTLAEESWRLARQIGDRWGEAWAMILVGAVNRDKPDYAQAERIFTEGLALTESIRDRGLAGGYHNGLAELLNILGEPHQALPHAEAALQTYLDTNGITNLGYSFLNIAHAYHLIGDREKTLAYIDCLLSMPERTGSRLDVIQAKNLHGYLALEQDEFDQAIRWFTDARDQYAQPNTPIPICLEAITGLAEAYWRCGQLQSAKTTIDEVVKWLVPHRLAVSEFPLRVYGSAYRVLIGLADSRAESVLASGLNYLQLAARGLSDERRAHFTAHVAERYGIKRKE
jgi:tetratricopeptide (TPR) repeat protein